jgi:hypothetical protein
LVVTKDVILGTTKDAEAAEELDEAIEAMDQKLNKDRRTGLA